MALTYTGGTGVFDKLGALIDVINSFEEFEVGGLTTALSGIQGKLETVNEYDDQARQLFYSIDSEERNALRSWKQDMLALFNPILTQALYTGENFYSSNLNEMLNFLKFCMNRDTKTVDGSTITVTGPAAGTPTPTGDFTLLASKYAPTVQGADASSQENGIIWSNPYRVICTQNSTSGGEQFQIQGNLPLAGRTHPDWMNAGDAGRLTMISSVSNTMVQNGGFEFLNSTADMFTSWALTTGAYTTDLVRDATPYRGTYSLKLVNSAKITQTLPLGVLKPYTKYLITLKAKKAGSADGTLNIGFTGTTGCFYSAAASGLSTSFVLKSVFFNTGPDPSDIVDFIVERTGSTTGNVYIDELTLTQTPLVHGLGLAVVAGTTDPAINDIWTVRAQNNLEGTIMNFFGRWYDFLLPGLTNGSENIADSVAE